jgi:putative transposase
MPRDEETPPTTTEIYAATCEEVEVRRKSFIRRWRLKHRAVADSLQEARERPFFIHLPPSHWRSVRTTDAIERYEEFKRRIKMQAQLPSADTAAMLSWALLASGQISMRKSLSPRRRRSMFGKPRCQSHRIDLAA